MNTKDFEMALEKIKEMHTLQGYAIFQLLGALKGTNSKKKQCSTNSYTAKRLQFIKAH